MNSTNDEYVDKDKFDALIARAAQPISETPYVKGPKSKAKATVEDIPDVMPCEVCGEEVDITDSIRIVRARRAFCREHGSSYHNRPLMDAPSLDQLLHLIDAYNDANPNVELSVSRTFKQK